MARVLVAEHAGACFGVERALGMVQKAADASTTPVYTLGPLIHNPVVVADLADSGVCAVEDPADAHPGSMIFMRTHGVTPEVEDHARSLALDVHDATCPFVKKVHLAAEALAKEGYAVLVVGEAGHPEIEGTLGHVPGAVVVGSADEVKTMDIGQKVGVVVQTTLAEKTLCEVVSALACRCTELRVINTICDATSKRQAAAAKLARESDVMVVIGGRNSANTTHLAEICCALCKRTHHIEFVEELDAAWFEDAKVIGITAGASTPAGQIESVRDRIDGLTDSKPTVGFES